MLLGQDAGQIEKFVREAGFEIVESEADLCICFGGDGTLLGAERDYPGLPKVPVRRRASGPQAAKFYRELLGRVIRGESEVTQLPKLRTCLNGKQTLLALNDVFLRNAHITSAVRYRVTIDDIEHFGEIVGDGLVVSTPFGSSAYYRSITNSVIHVGIGLAFNNSTEPVNHLVLSSKSLIRIEITRGPALLAADNNPNVLPIDEGDVIDIESASEKAVIWEINNLLCMDRTSPKNGRRLRWLHPSAGDS